MKGNVVADWPVPLAAGAMHARTTSPDGKDTTMPPTAMAARRAPVERATYDHPAILPPRLPPQARAVVAFWQHAGPEMRFAKDPTFDRHFRDRFLDLHEYAAAGARDHWLSISEGALALVLLLDQFPRNAFRGTARMYATDPIARRIAGLAIAAGHERAVAADLALFFCLPFGHSERIADQDRSVALATSLGLPIQPADRHRDIIRRFGRFPHRNAVLGRMPTPEEQAFLEGGGYAG